MTVSQAVINQMIKDMARASAFLIEQRIREAIHVSGVIPADLNSGAASLTRITTDHPDCSGTGIRMTRDDVQRRIFVELCPCFEVRVVVDIRPCKGVLSMDGVIVGETTSFDLKLAIPEQDQSTDQGDGDHRS